MNTSSNYPKKGELDIPFVPSSDDRIKHMIELADIKPGEKAVDLGAGDGKVVIALAEKGARVEGYEIDAERTLLAQKNIKNHGLSHTASVYNQDFWHVPLDTYDVITIYGITYIMGKLEEKLHNEASLHCRIVSNGYRLPRWKPVTSTQSVYLYIKNYSDMY